LSVGRIDPGKESMKAVVVEKYDSIDNIHLQDVRLPDVASGQLRIRVQAASLGFVDGLKVQGRYQTKDALHAGVGVRRDRRRSRR
jgi:NADPH:quinone reductase-like Zn-dependent oxidoreductase